MSQVLQGFKFAEAAGGEATAQYLKEWFVGPIPAPTAEDPEATTDLFSISFRCRPFDGDGFKRGDIDYSRNSAITLRMHNPATNRVVKYFDLAHLPQWRDTRDNSNPDARNQYASRTGFQGQQAPSSFCDAFVRITRAGDPGMIAAVFQSIADSLPWVTEPPAQPPKVEEAETSPDVDGSGFDVEDAGPAY